MLPTVVVAEPTRAGLGAVACGLVTGAVCLAADIAPGCGRPGLCSVRRRVRGLGIGLAVAGAMGVQESPWQSITLQIVGALFNMAAFIARLTYQRGLSRECP